jgi:hypothetical protein
LFIFKKIPDNYGITVKVLLQEIEHDDLEGGKSFGNGVG